VSSSSGAWSASYKSSMMSMSSCGHLACSQHCCTYSLLQSTRPWRAV
jgi:hypothetical protein